jgi:replication factor C subunit 3/5
MNIPWVEKYRPTDFENIILDPLNKRFFENIIKKRYFPNMLFYGQPGTGKTTTIINIVNQFLNRTGNEFNESIIHLNASDERGIDIIRNQINIFVKSNHLFNRQLKIIILDEVDYMTKNAQQALKYILQNTYENVRFCLICNYISKIDINLKNEFICIRFNQLPKPNIINLVENICKKEELSVSTTDIERIYNLHKNDIRTIINYIQLNSMEYIIDDTIYENIVDLINQHNIGEREFIKYIHELSINYNIDKIEIIMRLFNYLIYNYRIDKSIYDNLLQKIEYIIHNINLVNIFVILKYIWWNITTQPIIHTTIDISTNIQVEN